MFLLWCSLKRNPKGDSLFLGTLLEGIGQNSCLYEAGLTQGIKSSISVSVRSCCHGSRSEGFGRRLAPLRFAADFCFGFSGSNWLAHEKNYGEDIVGIYRVISIAWFLR